MAVSVRCFGLSMLKLPDDWDKLAQTRGARRVVGVDIDDALVRAAWKRRRTLWSMQAPASPSESHQENELPETLRSLPKVNGNKRKRAGSILELGSESNRALQEVPRPQPDHFPASCEHMYGPLPIPSSAQLEPEFLQSGTFPHNVVFRTADWVAKTIPEDAGGYDVVLACVFFTKRIDNHTE